MWDVEPERARAKRESPAEFRIASGPKSTEKGDKDEGCGKQPFKSLIAHHKKQSPKGGCFFICLILICVVLLV